MEFQRLLPSVAGALEEREGFLLGLSLGRFLAVGGFAADRISWLAGTLVHTRAHARPNGVGLSCGALKKDSFPNLRAPPASSAC